MNSVQIPKPHAVCVALPAQSHTKAMLILAKLLHSRGVQITFINTEFNHKLILQSVGMESLAGLTDFQILTIPDGLPLSDSDIRQDSGVLMESIRNNCLGPLVEQLEKNIPPVSCIISDGFLTYTIDAGEKLGIPVVLLWTVAACSLMGYRQLPHVLEKGFVPFKGTNTEYLDTIIEWVPSKNGIHVKDLPSINRQSDTEEKIFNISIEATLRCSKASANIINTFDELEADIVSLLSSSIPQLYTIGPLHLLLDQEPKKELLNSIGCSLWKEEHLCLKWLDSKEPNSVLYVNFGSLVALTSEKVVELAIGLANSNQNFLWTITPDFVMDDSAILPPGFLEETKERGFVTSWCPQEQVLNHSSVRVFLTHSGWNSTVESISAGVPMICFPLFFEQPMNCRYTCTEWGIGMELSRDFNKHDVEKIVKEMMEGENGKKMKEKALEWKEKAYEAIGTNGSSWLNLDMLIKNFFSY